MLLFTSILFALSAFSLLEINNKKFDYFLFLFSLITLFLIAAFRTKGYDYESYNMIYNTCRNGGLMELDLLFAFICKICPSYRILLFLMAFISLSCFGKVIYKWSPMPIMSILIFYSLLFFSGTMGQMRQNAAIGLVLLAYYYKSEKLKSIIIFIIAVFLHAAAFLGIIFFIPLKKKLSFGVYSLGIIIALAFGDILIPQLNFVISLTGSSFLANKLAFYIASETMKGISVSFNSAVLIRCIVFSLAYFLIKNKEPRTIQFINIYYISIIWYLAFGFLPQLGVRGSLYFSVLDIILIPQIISSQKEITKLIAAIGFIVLSILRFNQFFSDNFNYNSFVPYFN